ncbi:MAG: hypothetical protein H6741_31745 [Alphaproteobacteria bacterium]|nr:hypothetical protein [Alphaproteobacteria bacterium]
MRHDDDNKRRQERARELETLALRLLAKELLGRPNVGKEERDQASALLAELER